MIDCCLLLLKGQRFAKTQLKMALVMIIRNFQFYLTPGGTNPLEEGLMLQFQKVAEERRISSQFYINI